MRGATVFDGEGEMFDERARIVHAARRHAGLTCQALMLRLSGSEVVSEADVWRREDGEHVVTESYVRAVLRACGLPEDWRGPAVEEKAEHG